MLLCPWGFPRQEYWSGLPFPPPGDPPDPEIELWSPALPTDSLLSEPAGKLHVCVYIYVQTHLFKLRNMRVCEMPL